MRPEYFQYLLEIKRTRSISSAAKSLHIGQTTLSAIVKSVESELGFSIFRRTPAGVDTTPEGERLMALAWQIDIKYEELLSLKNHSTSNARPIPLLVCPSVNIGLSVPLSQKFYQFELRGNLVFEEFPRLDIYFYILQNSANVGVSYLTPAEVSRFALDSEANHIKVTPLLRDRFYLFVSSDHPLARRTSVTMEDIYGECLAYVTNFRTYDSDKLFGTLERNCARIVSFPDTLLMKQAILEQRMVGLLAGYAIAYSRNLSPSQYCAVPIDVPEQDNQIDVCLICRTSRELRYQERILVNCIETYFQELLPPPAADEFGVWADWWDRREPK